MQLTVSTGSSLAVLFGMVGAISPAFVNDRISEPGEPTTFAHIALYFSKSKTDQLAKGCTLVITSTGTPMCPCATYVQKCRQ